MSLSALLAALALWGALAPSAKAEVQFIPESRHQQYLTYGLFTDQHTSLLLRDHDRAWGDLSVSFALLEVKHWAWRPQLVAHCTAAVSYRFNDRHDTLLTETIDAKVGLTAEFEVSPELRFWLGWTHYSGHAVDNISPADIALFGPNLGDELLQLRGVYDVDHRWRLGATLKPIIGAEPAMKAFAADQFAEWYPWGVASDFRRPTPYIAGGLEQYGADSIELTEHAQIGIFFGNHFEPEHRSSIRFVLGFYNGNDPRLKYYQFKRSRDHFFYIGTMLEI